MFIFSLLFSSSFLLIPYTKQNSHFRYAQSKRSTVCQSVDGLSFAVCCTNFYIPSGIFVKQEEIANSTKKHTQSHSHTCILGATSNTFILWNQYEVSTQKRSTPQCYALQSIDKIERTNEVTKLKCSWNIRDAITSTENMQEEKNKVFTIN